MTRDGIEALITRLVHEAPTLDPAVVAALVEALDADGRPLAQAISRVTQLVAAHRIDMGIALPPLAMACATLADPALGLREHDAARYEIETLLPMPAEPDVPADRLTRLTLGRRPRT